MIISPSIRAAITDDSLDGCGALILSLAKKAAAWRGAELDDVFQEAVLHYLEAKHKYDETRSKRTTFITIVLKKLKNPVAAKRQPPPKTQWENVELCTYDPDTQQYSDDALTVLEMASTWPRQMPGKKKDIVRAATKWPHSRVRRAWEEIQNNLASLGRDSQVYYTSGCDE